MECLNIDFIGPFPDQEYKAPSFSYFRRFKAPHHLPSDNGPHFIAEVIREFLFLIGVSHTLTLAYSRQENTIVERYNKEINRHLRALM